MYSLEIRTVENIVTQKILYIIIFPIFKHFHSSYIML